MVKRVPLFGKEKQFAVAVLKFVELGALQTLAQGDELGVASDLADPPNPSHEIRELGELRAQLVKLGGRGRFVNQRIARRLVQIVLVLLGVGKPALRLSEPAGSLSGRKTIQLAKQIVELLVAAAKRLVDRVGGTREAPLKYGAGERDAVLAASRGLRLVREDNGLLKGAIGQTNTTFIARRPLRAQRTDILQNDGHVEVSGERHPTANVRG